MSATLAEIDWPAFAASHGGIPTETDRALVRQKSRDFYWYSPVLKQQLRGVSGDIVVAPRDEAERREILKTTSEEELKAIFYTHDLVKTDSAIFCATGISDSPLLPGVRVSTGKAITHSILMRARSKTVRYIRAVHNLEKKTIHLRSTASDRELP